MIVYLGINVFFRIKIGIGWFLKNDIVIYYVLSIFFKEIYEEMLFVVKKVVDVVLYVCEGYMFVEIMN